MGRGDEMATMGGGGGGDVGGGGGGSSRGDDAFLHAHPLSDASRLARDKFERGQCGDWKIGRNRCRNRKRKRFDI